MTAPGPSWRALAPAVAAMAFLVVVSNVLVAYPLPYFGLGEWLTWAAFTYPVTFVVNDLTNRRFGPAAAMRVVAVGFALGVILSVAAAGLRIGLASGIAFLAAQLLDALVFDRLRRQTWWRAPAISSVLGSILDTALFFSIAFAFTSVPWITLAVGDLAVKLLLALVMLAPFRLAMAHIRALPNPASGTAATGCAAAG
ncbi:MAG: VUT family protein [Alphaproteobacteria bacterium]|nr:VUT family protein [Alphaproteobacteria bacterium]